MRQPKLSARISTARQPALWRVFSYSRPGLPRPTISQVSLFLENSINIEKTGLHGQARRAIAEERTGGHKRPKPFFIIAPFCGKLQPKYVQGGKKVGGTPLSLRGAQRRGNLPVQSLLLLCSLVDGTRRLPRPKGLAMTRNGGSGSNHPASHHIANAYGTLLDISLGIKRNFV